MSCEIDTGHKINWLCEHSVQNGEGCEIQLFLGPLCQVISCEWSLMSTSVSCSRCCVGKHLIRNFIQENARRSVVGWKKIYVLVTWCRWQYLCVIAQPAFIICWLSDTQSQKRAKHGWGQYFLTLDKKAFGYSMSPASTGPSPPSLLLGMEICIQSMNGKWSLTFSSCFLIWLSLLTSLATWPFLSPVSHTALDNM